MKRNKNTDKLHEDLSCFTFEDDRKSPKVQTFRQLAVCVDCEIGMEFNKRFRFEAVYMKTATYVVVV
jgi:hypothetical protein